MTDAVAAIALYLTLPADQFWPEQGEWTYDDFLRLPDDGLRYEIIEGALYLTNAPDPEYQYTVGEIFAEIRRVAKEARQALRIPPPLRSISPVLPSQSSQMCCSSLRNAAT